MSSSPRATSTPASSLMSPRPRTLGGTATRKRMRAGTALKRKRMAPSRLTALMWIAIRRSSLWKKSLQPEEEFRRRTSRCEQHYTMYRDTYVHHIQVECTAPRPCILCAIVRTHDDLPLPLFPDRLGCSTCGWVGWIT